mgnify:CR=1 FL=1
MKKFFMMIALLTIPFAMQAQTKFHDVEANEAQGPVKSVTVTIKQQVTSVVVTTTVTFTPDGKIANSEGATISDAVYDENGYLLSCVTTAQGSTAKVSYEWENGRVKSQTSTKGDFVMKVTNCYDENGHIISAITEMGGNKSEMKISDYQFDDHGNWISRKQSMMGQENTFISIIERSIEYYQ